MRVCIVLTLVCVSLVFQTQFCAAGRKGSGSRDDWRPQVGDDGGSLGSCQAQGRGSRTLKNRIIRTKDSIDNGACFADAIVVDSIKECSEKCCSYSGNDCEANCDTSIFVHETGDEINCFLFVCGDDDDCKFSYHNGYTTTMFSNHRERIEQQSTTLTTTTPQVFQKKTTFPRAPSTKAWTTTATWDLPTTRKEENKASPKPEKQEPENDISQGCGHFEYQCGSGECYKFAYVCDGIIDCRDNSDETGCDYSTTINMLTTSAPEVKVRPTHQDTANNLQNHSPAEDSSSPEVASESKTDIPSKHDSGGKNLEGDKVVGKGQVGGRVSDDQEEHDGGLGGLTQELHSKGQERIKEPDENEGLTLTDLQDDLHALSDTGDGRGGKDQETGKNTGSKSMSGEYDKNDDYGGVWEYDDDDDDRDAENHLAQDLYGTKYEEEHKMAKDENSLKAIGKGKEGKSGQDYGKYDIRKPDGYERNQKEETPDASREDSSSVQRDSYNPDGNMDGRPVYEAVGRKLDNVKNLPHTRKNGHQNNDDYQKNDKKHQMKTSGHTENERFESSQKADKGGHKDMPPEEWKQTDGAKGGWEGGSYTSESVDADDIDKGLVRDKGDKWLQQRPVSNPRDHDDEYYNRNKEDKSPDSRWHEDVVSRNRNRGWPENVNDGRGWNDDEYDHPSKMKNNEPGEYEPVRQPQNYVGKWQDKQRRPESVQNHVPKYHQQAPNWYNDHRGRRPDYNRDYEYIGRGENPHQFWNQYKNEQLKPHHRPADNNADSYEQYSDDYGNNVASFDDQNREDTEDVTTTTKPQHHPNKVKESTTIKPTTPDGNSSNDTLTQLPSNITVTPKKTFGNTSNKNGSSHTTLFKKKSRLSDKSLTSAILPLAFGLLITVLLLLLVGCRLRQVNRRLRYGRLKTNVAEADYLINGMYL